MAILFLHCSIQPPLFPGLPAMLEELSEPTTVVLPASMLEAQPDVSNVFDRVIAIPGGFGDFIDSSVVEIECARAHADEPFSRIVTTGELGILRGARLRAALGVRGQSVESALAYRDKVRMKALCASRGIPVAPHEPIDGPADLLRFARGSGFPIVLKPRAGAGSIDTKLIRNEDELTSVLKTMRAATIGLGTNLLAESFVRGQLLHVNGYAGPDTRVHMAWPASYLERGNLEVVLEGSVSGEYLLDRDDPRVARMRAFTERCLHALPWPEDGFAFHLEVFEDDESGALTLCEVACRQGGGTINDIYECAFGVSLLEASLRLQAGLPIAGQASNPTQLFGGVQAPLREGTLVLSSTAPPPWPWVVRHEFRLKSGEKAVGPKSCVDSSANFVVSGESVHTVRSRLEQVMAWYDGIASWTSNHEGVASNPQGAIQRACA